MINEKSVYMKKVNKVAKKLKRKDKSLHHNLCLKMAFNQVNKKRTIRVAKVIDVNKQIADKWLLRVLGI